MTAQPHPLIEGLFAELPPAGSVWSAEDQATWFRAAGAIFDLIYRQPEDEPGEIRAHVGPAKDWRQPVQIEARAPVPEPAAAVDSGEGQSSRGDCNSLAAEADAGRTADADRTAQTSAKGATSPGGEQPGTGDHPKPPVKAGRWSAEEEARVRQMWRDGNSPREIAAALGRSQESASQYIYMKLGLRRGAATSGPIKSSTPAAEPAPTVTASKRESGWVRCAGCRVHFMPHKAGETFCAECRRFDPGAKASSAVAPAPVRKRSGPPAGFLPKPWTAEEDAELRRWWATSTSAAAIGKLLKRSEQAVMAHAGTLGLPGRKGRDLTDDVAEHIARHGVTRLPTAAVLPTSAEISGADRAAVAKHNEALEAARTEQNQRRGRPAATT